MNLPTETPSSAHPQSSASGTDSVVGCSGGLGSVAWRDLQHGEVMQAGDRMLCRNLAWRIWTEDDIDSRRPVVIDAHTFPAQRPVSLPNARGQTCGASAPAVKDGK